ncbi:hypothetical protein B0H66DRAFT_532240 [Apodospora peruviana]|uniref:Uncharacterized protein n=1 Tax=Apodospora peruviana TaxID=516989 RepID=A0AAE0M813_9PEZI|nr:hypothetical protein B0H66DRAFT_532240 [Apodospora peruviana]
MASLAPEENPPLPTFCGEAFEPDPDIAGIGVVASFIITDSLVMLLVSIQLARDYPSCLITIKFTDAEGKKIRFSDETAIPEIISKPAIHPQNNNADKANDNGSDTEELLSDQPSTLKLDPFRLADTQFAIGIAICVAALLKEDITEAHYMICVEMGWLA